MSCDVMSNDDPTAASFMKNGEELMNGTNGYEITKQDDYSSISLQKNNPESSDDGEYKCSFNFTDGPPVAKAGTITVARMYQHS